MSCSGEISGGLNVGVKTSRRLRPTPTKPPVTRREERGARQAEGRGRVTRSLASLLRSRYWCLTGWCLELLLQLNKENNHHRNWYITTNCHTSLENWNDKGWLTCNIFGIFYIRGKGRGFYRQSLVPHFLQIQQAHSCWLLLSIIRFGRTFKISIQSSNSFVFMVATLKQHRLPSLQTPTPHIHISTRFISFIYNI